MVGYDIKNWESVNGAISLSLGDIDQAVAELLAGDDADFTVSTDRIRQEIAAGGSRTFNLEYPSDIDGGKVVRNVPPAQALEELGRWMLIWKQQLEEKVRELKRVSSLKYEPYWRSPLHMYEAGDAWRNASAHGQPIPTQVSQMNGGEWQGPASDRYRDIIKEQAGATDVMAGLVATTGTSMLNASVGVQGLFNSYLNALTQTAADLRALPGKQGLGTRRRAAIQVMQHLINFVDKTLFDKDREWKKAVAQAHQHLKDNGTLKGQLQFNQWPSSDGDVDLSGVRGKPDASPPTAGEQQAGAAVPTDAKAPGLDRNTAAEVRHDPKGRSSPEAFAGEYGDQGPPVF